MFYTSEHYNQTVRDRPSANINIIDSYCPVFIKIQMNVSSLVTNIESNKWYLSSHSGDYEDNYPVGYDTL
jgi:hypothetical protein